MTLRNVAKDFSLEDQRQEINEIAADLNQTREGTYSFSGYKTFSSAVVFNAGITSNNVEAVFSSATIGDLTEGRVVIVGTNGALVDTDKLTWDSTEEKLVVDGEIESTTFTSQGTVVGGQGANITGAECVFASATVSDLTDGRVVLAGTLGALEDSAKLTFDGTDLNVTGNVDITGQFKVSSSPFGLSHLHNVDIATTPDADQVLAYNNLTGNWRPLTVEVDEFDWSTETTIPSYIKNITQTNVTDWNDAAGWGDHSLEGYLKSESDTLGTVTARGASTTTAVTFEDVTINGTLTYSGSQSNTSQNAQVGTSSLTLNADVGKYEGNASAGGSIVSGITSTAGIVEGQPVSVVSSTTGQTLSASATIASVNANGTEVTISESFGGGTGSTVVIYTPVAPTANASIIAERSSLADAIVRFNEGSNIWQFYDGTTWGHFSNYSLEGSTSTSNHVILKANPSVDDGNPVSFVELIGTSDLNIDWDSVNKKATFSLPDVAGITAGSYTNTNITVNDKGIITSIANGQSGGGGSSTVSIAANPPVSPSAGDMWWSSLEGRLKIYYTDETPDSYWVDANPPLAGVPLTDGDKGDIVVSSSGTVWEIDATGTKDNTTFLRGDNTWATPPGTGAGGSIVSVPVFDQSESTSGGTYTTTTYAGGGHRVDFANTGANRHVDVKFEKLDNDKIYEFAISYGSNGTDPYYGWYFTDKQTTRSDNNATTTASTNKRISDKINGVNPATDHWKSYNRRDGTNREIVGDQLASGPWNWPSNGYEWDPMSGNQGEVGTWHFVIDMPRNKIWVKEYNESWENGDLGVWKGQAPLGDPIDPLSNPSVFLRKTGTGDYYFNIGMFIPSDGTGYCSIYSINDDHSTFRKGMKGDAGADGASDFLTLSDVPNNFTGQDGKFLKVNSTEDALEFTDAPTSGANVSMSLNAPATPAVGDLWWKTDEGKLKINYDDGDSTQWVDASPTLAQTSISDGTNTLEADGNLKLTGHIIPTSNAAYDLGNAEYKIRHLFLSDNSLWVGDEHKVSIDSGKMRFRKRKKTALPKALTDLGANVTQVLDFYNNNLKPSGYPAKSQAQDLTVDNMMGFIKSLNPELTQIEDLYPPKFLPDGNINPAYTDDDWEDQQDAIGGQLGIAEIDQWVTTTITSDDDADGYGATNYPQGPGNPKANRKINNNILGDITTNTQTAVSRSPSPFAKKGSGMTETAGVFTFPSNGMWEIEFITRFEATGTLGGLNGNERGDYYAYIEHSPDGGTSWDDIRSGQFKCRSAPASAANEDQQLNVKTIISISDFTQERCRFKVNSTCNGIVHGGSKGATVMTFKKIG